MHLAALIQTIPTARIEAKQWFLHQKLYCNSNKLAKYLAKTLQQHPLMWVEWKVFQLKIKVFCIKELYHHHELSHMCPSKRKPTLQVKSYYWDN